MRTVQIVCRDAAVGFTKVIPLNKSGFNTLWPLKRLSIFEINSSCMKKLTLITLLITIAVSVFFSACKKKPVHIKTNTELLTQTSWKFDKATASGVDISSQVPACMKDNITTFVSNGTGTIDEGTTLCSPPTAGGFT